jgi:energy-coupling factor transporter transmembrane protein EcfT
VTAGFNRSQWSWPGGEGSAERRRRQLADLHVLRYVPGEGPLQRCWAGTKILSIAALSLGMLLWPSWATAGIAAVVLFASLLAARLPRGVAPRVPVVVVVVLLIGAVLALVSGTPPFVHLGRVKVGLGGLEVWARFLVLGIEVLAFAALVSWTTPLADLAPALGRLASPLRRLRLPVDEVVAAIALGIRCLPLLIEEVRVLAAARRTRRPEPLRGFQQHAEALQELLFTALASSLRRSRELAEAIEARGGVPGPVGETHPWRPVDTGIMLLVAAAVAAMGLLR